MSIFLVSLGTYLGGLIELGSALALNTVATYLCFYVMHEASHRIAHPDRQVNDALGRIAAFPLLISFACFRDRHLAHHAYTNAPGRDPDFGVSRRPRIFLPLWLYFPISYRIGCYGKCHRNGHRSPVVSQLLVDGVLLSSLLLAGYLGVFLKTVALAILPALLAVPTLSIVFSFLPHRPFESTDRFFDTRDGPSAILSVLLLGQNYHLTHHLWVKVPWFRLQSLHHHVRDELRMRNCVISWRNGPSSSKFPDP